MSALSKTTDLRDHETDIQTLRTYLKSHFGTYDIPGFEEMEWRIGPVDIILVLGTLNGFNVEARWDPTQFARNMNVSLFTQETPGTLTKGHLDKVDFRDPFWKIMTNANSARIKADYLRSFLRACLILKGLTPMSPTYISSSMMHQTRLAIAHIR
ncbi:hypothetical protein K491DRAFT_711246 [Lophiostoma macrostomum CBS 122681]|uniref:Uncharacterized protein n=1 Tax=Lophiostoma macrostomum CBS 122681 TaxID=1314788 RepID=A0A6A6TPW3_9PLEO|nr:hypothetical protein K491DRAFT_711246 [Lophiostoma macrostomum CBS 122681]